jgi:CBS domain-containing protein
MDPSEKPLSQVMTERPISIDADELADVALALMHACRFRHLPVMRHGELIGLLSLPRLLEADDLHHVAVSQVMMEPPPSVPAATPVREAVERMLHDRLTCLTVLDGGRLAGLCTRTDLLRTAIDVLRTDDAPGRPCPVSRLMTHPPLRTVAPTETIENASRMMTREDIRHLPVVSGERLIGMLSDHDLLAARGGRLGIAHEEGAQRAPTERLVGEVMSKRVITVSPDEQAVHAAEVLYRRRIGALPVLTRGRLCGLLAVSDYFQYLVNISGAAPHQAAPRALAGHRRS